MKLWLRKKGANLQKISSLSVSSCEMKSKLCITTVVDKLAGRRGTDTTHTIADGKRSCALHSSGKQDSQAYWYNRLARARQKIHSLQCKEIACYQAANSFTSPRVRQIQGSSKYWKIKQGQIHWLQKVSNQFSLTEIWVVGSAWFLVHDTQEQGPLVSSLCPWCHTYNPSSLGISASSSPFLCPSESLPAPPPTLSLALSCLRVAIVFPNRQIAGDDHK